MPEAADPPEQRHEALVCVRLTAATPGSRLLEFLRAEPCAVGAWWIAADIDAVVRLASPSRTLLNRAVADLRRRGGAEVLAVHSVLRALDLPATDPPVGDRSVVRGAAATSGAEGACR
ncbi:hypothetical protein [Micromonospora okii]|uniref:hypothetical protein n=1 Tax=Micromonospora okii TaxID=1182970 RepID=UPI001E477F98|nr:hypothetical protein [Micromonospora okii]